MSKLVVIENTVVRQDAFGRYCLNDLHKAAGDFKKDSPAYWLANKQTQELIEQFLSDGGIPVSVIKGGIEQGTYVAKELVYAYAMWISAAFNLKVIRTFDKAISAPEQPLTDQLQAGLALLSFAKQEFRLAPSAVLGSLQQLQSSLGMPDILPAYAVDAPEGSTTGSTRSRIRSLSFCCCTASPTPHSLVSSACNCSDSLSASHVPAASIPTKRSCSGR